MHMQILGLPSWDALMPFMLGVLILQLSPGPDMLLILNRGIANGPRIAFSTIAGIVVVAGIVQIGLLVLGLGTLLSQHPAAMPVLQIFGALYLLYLGVRMMTTRLCTGVREAPRPEGLKMAVCEGAVSSLSNPKSFLFLFVFLPQFLDPASGPVWIQMLFLGTLHKIASLVTLSSVALAARKIGVWMRRWPLLLSLQRNACGLLMVVISLGLASQIQFLMP